MIKRKRVQCKVGTAGAKRRVGGRGGEDWEEETKAHGQTVACASSMGHGGSGLPYRR